MMCKIQEVYDLLLLLVLLVCWDFLIMLIQNTYHYALLITEEVPKFPKTVFPLPLHGGSFTPSWSLWCPHHSLHILE